MSSTEIDFGGDDVLCCDAGKIQEHVRRYYSYVKTLMLAIFNTSQIISPRHERHFVAKREVERTTTRTVSTVMAAGRDDECEIVDGRERRKRRGEGGGRRPAAAIPSPPPKPVKKLIYYSFTTTF